MVLMIFCRIDDAEAEKILTRGTSAFHKTGHAAVSFLRALIGFEGEVMKEGIAPNRAFARMWLIVAAERIAEAETAADRQRKLAVKDNRPRGRYEPGTSPL